MIDYRDLFPPCPLPMYGVSQPLFMRAHQGKIYPSQAMKESCAYWIRSAPTVCMEFDQPGVCLLNTLHYTVKLQGGYLCPGYSREKPTFLGEIKLPMGYPELIK